MIYKGNVAELNKIRKIDWILTLVPFVFIVLQSFRCENTWMVGYVLPKEWGFDNYIQLFNYPEKNYYK